MACRANFHLNLFLSGSHFKCISACTDNMRLREICWMDFFLHSVDYYTRLQTFCNIENLSIKKDLTDWWASPLNLSGCSRSYERATTPSPTPITPFQGQDGRKGCFQERESHSAYKAQLHVPSSTTAKGPWQLHQRGANSAVVLRVATANPQTIRSGDRNAPVSERSVSVRRRANGNAITLGSQRSPVTCFGGNSPVGPQTPPY